MTARDESAKDYYTSSPKIIFWEQAQELSDSAKPYKMDNVKEWTFDLSSLINGTSPQVTKQRTYNEDNGALAIKMKINRVGRRYIGINISLEATYTGDGDYDGVTAIIRSKGRRPEVSFYSKFKENEPKQVLLYNECLDLQSGNLGDHLREARYLDVELGKTCCQNIFYTTEVPLRTPF